MMLLNYKTQKEHNMSVFTDIFNKIVGKIKSLVPGANTLSDVDLTAELDKLAKGSGYEWKTSVVDFLKLIGQTAAEIIVTRWQKSWVLTPALKAEAHRKTKLYEKPSSRKLP